MDAEHFTSHNRNFLSENAVSRSYHILNGVDNISFQEYWAQLAL